MLEDMAPPNKSCQLGGVSLAMWDHSHHAVLPERTPPNSSRRGRYVLDLPPWIDGNKTCRDRKTQGYSKVLLTASRKVMSIFVRLLMNISTRLL